MKKKVKRYKNVLNYDFYGTAKDRNLKFGIAVTFNIKMLAKNSFKKKFKN